MPDSIASHRWPPLPLDGWRDTYATLHMWTQIVGKIVLRLTPPVNHFWNVTLHLTSRGLTTPPMRTGDRTLVITFDFVSHQLVFDVSDGRTSALPLESRSVAEFYDLVMRELDGLDVRTRIWTRPVEIPDPIPFDRDTVHHTYDPATAAAFFQALVAMYPVFQAFRGRFIGKCSPVHFFWGGFDLAVTRFSGRRAPERPDADAITREGYSHEVISHGFWPGSGPTQQAAFYAYAAPEPDGFRTAPVAPASAYFEEATGIFVLPYDSVRTAASPAATLTAFLESTYDAGARLANWNRAELERPA